MSKPNTGTYGITIEHLNNLRKQFDCYYSHIFMGMYDLKEMNFKLVNLLIHSVTHDEYLPTKEKVLEYQAQFEKEEEDMSKINDMFSKKLRE